ncbi:hypothetical protein D3C87_2178990 [compost metagenome]
MAPNANTFLAMAASITPTPCALKTSAPCSTCAIAASLALGGSNHEPMKVCSTLISGFTSLAPAS